MNRIKSLGTLGVVLLLLFACNPATVTSPDATATATVVTQEPASFPLSEPGPYHTVIRTYEFADASRDGRKVGITVWYPAVRPASSTGSSPTRDANPDASGAPYPPILSSAKVGNIFASHLASHGFVVAGISRMDSADRWSLWLIDYPLDIAFALDQIASNSLGGLEGMIDADHAGTMGYSFDGYNALALSGARIDPEFYLAQCAEAPMMKPALPAWWIEYICDMAGEWEEFVTHAGNAITSSDDGLWQPMADERIRAVMPMAPEGAWLFGERGLAAVNRPTLIIGATRDDINIYDLEAVYIFEHLGTPDRAMISFVGEGHMMIYEASQVARMKHFATAFFGYYLQGRDGYGGYFSEDFVAQHDELAWGVYTGE
jgi:predicted dienelactone hydrolase